MDFLETHISVKLAFLGFVVLHYFTSCTSSNILTFFLQFYLSCVFFTCVHVFNNTVHLYRMENVRCSKLMLSFKFINLISANLISDILILWFSVFALNTVLTCWCVWTVQLDTQRFTGCSSDSGAYYHIVIFLICRSHLK